MKHFVASTFFLAIVLLCNSTQVLANDEHITLRDLGAAPSFSLLDEDGVPVSQEIHTSGPSLVNFFFTSCKGPCPALMQKLKLIIAKSTCASAQFLSISVDPEVDSPEVIKSYREDHGFNDPRWKLLTGDKKTIDRIQNEYKVGKGPDKSMHSVRFILLDSSGKIRALIKEVSSATIAETLDNLCQQ